MIFGTREEAVEHREQLRDRIVVFTNGCFDLLHAGHLHLLESAREQGDYLLVGVNSDDSVRRIKGPNRPVLPEEDRLRLLEALEPVDGVVLFSKDTPEELIAVLEPDVLVKGADYERDEIVGADLVEGAGGQVYRVPLKEGRGTSDLIRSIRRTAEKTDG